MVNSTSSASPWWTASTMCCVFWRSSVVACTVKTYSVISPLPSTVVAPTSPMVFGCFSSLLESIALLFPCYYSGKIKCSITKAALLSLAETSMADNYHLDQSDGKRYSVDPGDSAFGSISSSYSPKSSYGFRSAQQFSNNSNSMNMCRQSSTSPNTFPESNRTGQTNHTSEDQFSFCTDGFVLPLGGYNTPSESQESKAAPNKDPTTWTVEDVVWFIRDADPQALGPHADVFRKHVSCSLHTPLLKTDLDNVQGVVFCNTFLICRDVPITFF